MAYIVMAHIVMAYIVMTFIVMAVAWQRHRRRLLHVLRLVLLLRLAEHQRLRQRHEAHVAGLEGLCDVGLDTVVVQCLLWYFSYGILGMAY